ncbi:hypothetical protein KR018_004626, partial [Drosophila ironensis]
MMCAGLLALVVATAAAAQEGALARTTSGGIKVKFLEPDESVEVPASDLGELSLHTYCFRGSSNRLLGLFETVEMSVEVAQAAYTQYGGATPEEVLRNYQERNTLFTLSLFGPGREEQTLSLAPFGQQCLGLATRSRHSVSVLYWLVDLWRLLQFLAGLLLVLQSRSLARNSLFYYLAGVVAGVVASVLIAIYLLSRLFPHRPIMYGVLIGGWTVGFFALRQLVGNLRHILHTYRQYVCWYIAVTGLVSFLVCYRIGPPQNRRSQNIVAWVLQLLGAAMMYFSSWYSDVAGFLVVLAFMAFYCPAAVLKYMAEQYQRRFPTHRRLLTQEEYYQQTAEATAQGLSELRTYVNSPHCRQWNLISNLNDPLRFAGFANGAPHLYDEEIEEYSLSIEETMGNTEPDEPPLEE